jgi:ATP phosphoribosyltransferase
LQENAEAFFTRAGLALAKPRGARDYRGTISGLDHVEIAYLSASEIASQLARGAIHLGVTGEDLVRESIADADKRVLLIDSLGFGSANVVVAVPQAWIDVRTMADLDDVTTGFRAQHNRRMRVATKYINLTRAFFAAHGIVDYRIVESAGATEGAPAVGTAEMIVDITTTGATLAANGLKVLDDGVILRSQASLVASRDADWSDQARETARVILDHIAARARASKYREVRTRFAACNAALLAEAHQRFGVVSPFGGPTSSGMVTLHCPPAQLYALGSFLRNHGAETVSPRWIMYSTAKTRCSPAWRLSCRIKAKSRGHRAQEAPDRRDNRWQLPYVRYRDGWNLIDGAWYGRFRPDDQRGECCGEGPFDRGAAVQ